MIWWYVPVVTNFLCRVTNSAHLVVGPSHQRLGIRCRLTSVIWCVVTSLSDVHWEHSCSLSTSVSSTLEVFFYDDALYKSTLSIYLSIYMLSRFDTIKQHDRRMDGWTEFPHQYRVSALLCRWTHDKNYYKCFFSSLLFHTGQAAVSCLALRPLNGSNAHPQNNTHLSSREQ